MPTIVLYDNSGFVSLRGRATQRGAVTTFGSLRGFGASKGGMGPVEVDIGAFNQRNWQKGVRWKRSKRAPAGTERYTFKPRGKGTWSATIRPSRDRKTHFVEITRADGSKQYAVSSENIAPWIIAVGIAAAVCLLATIITAFVTDCTKECGKPPKGVKVGVRFMDSFPYLPVCGKECIC